MILTKTRARRLRQTKGRSNRRMLAKAVRFPDEGNSAASAVSLRVRLGLTQAQFAPVLAVSIRSLASLEAGAVLTTAVRRRLTELARLTEALSEVIDRKAIGNWLRTPNQAFQGLKPIEVIERGEIDRLWEMIYTLRSGAAS